MQEFIIMAIPTRYSTFLNRILQKQQNIFTQRYYYYDPVLLARDSVFNKTYQTIINAYQLEKY